MCIDSLQKVYSVQKYWQKSKDTSFPQKKTNRATPEGDPDNHINNQSNKTDHPYSNTYDSWGLLLPLLLPLPGLTGIVIVLFIFTVP